MDWALETDAEAEKRQHSGAIDGRYQVCHPSEGLIEVADTLGEAFVIADRYAHRKLPDGRQFCDTPFEIEVHDRMARHGRPQTWRRQPMNATYCMRYGDKFSKDARWECIHIRK